MNGQNLSLLGLVNYNDQILDAFTFPKGIDREGTIQEIILQTAELELIYPDWNTMKTGIELWCSRNAVAWKKMLDTTTVKYNPIWNKDGVIKETETRDLHDVSGSDGTGTHNVAGYNSADLVTSDQDVSSASGTADHSGTITHERIEQGNIGVTTTQQMLKEEREIADYNVTDVIVQSFKKRFCIMIY